MITWSCLQQKGKPGQFPPNRRVNSGVSGDRHASGMQGCTRSGILNSLHVTVLMVQLSHWVSELMAYQGIITNASMKYRNMMPASASFCQLLPRDGRNSMPVVGKSLSKHLCCMFYRGGHQTLCSHAQFNQERECGKWLLEEATPNFKKQRYSRSIVEIVCGDHHLVLKCKMGRDRHGHSSVSRM